MTPFRQQVHAVMEKFGGEYVAECEPVFGEYQFTGPLGNWRATVTDEPGDRGVDVRFDNPAAAADVFAHWGVNPHSGKANWFYDDWPLADAVADVKRKIQTIAGFAG